MTPDEALLWLADHQGDLVEVSIVAGGVEVLSAEGELSHWRAAFERDAAQMRRALGTPEPAKPVAAPADMAGRYSIGNSHVEIDLTAVDPRWPIEHEDDALTVRLAENVRLRVRVLVAADDWSEAGR